MHPRHESNSFRSPKQFLGAVVGGAALAFIAAPAHGADDDERLAGVSDAADAAELVPAAAAGLPPVLPGQEPGARDRTAPAESAASGSWSNLTGDWAGLRTRLRELGVDLNGSLVTEWSDLLDGGVSEHSAFRFLLDVNATFDLAILAGLEGGSVFADFQTADAPVDGLDTGAFQAYSNIAIDGSITQLSQLWYEQWMFERALRLKLGKVDANAEFAYLGSAGGFINASAGFSPAIFALPTYPNPSTSVNLFVYPDDSIYVGAGLYDGAATVDGVPTGSRGPATFLSDDASDDWFVIAEAGITADSAGPFTRARVSVGAWWHSGQFARFDGGTEDGTAGLYAVAEGRVWHPEGVDLADEDDARGLWLFAQLGSADGSVSTVERQYGFGASLDGTFAGRDDDACGVYLTCVDFTGDPAAGLGSDEWAVEFFYDISVAPCVHVKPDIQWIDDAVVGSVRVVFTF